MAKKIIHDAPERQDDEWYSLEYKKDNSVKTYVANFSSLGSCMAFVNGLKRIHKDNPFFVYTVSTLLKV